MFKATKRLEGSNKVLMWFDPAQSLKYYASLSLFTGAKMI